MGVLEGLRRLLAEPLSSGANASPKKGTFPANPPLPPETRQAVLDLRREGWEQKDIAEELEISLKSVGRVLRAQQNPLSGQGTATAQITELTRAVKAIEELKEAIAARPEPTRIESSVGYETADDVLEAAKVASLRRLQNSAEFQRKIDESVLRDLGVNSGPNSRATGLREMIRELRELREEAEELGIGGGSGDIRAVLVEAFRPYVPEVIAWLSGRAAAAREQPTSAGLNPGAGSPAAALPEPTAPASSSTPAVARLLGVFEPEELAEVLRLEDHEAAAERAWDIFEDRAAALTPEARGGALGQVASFVALPLPLVRAYLRGMEQDTAWSPVLELFWGRGEDWVQGFRTVLQECLNDEDDEGEEGA